MSRAVYLGETALDRLRAAQAVLDQHVTSSATGRCRRCRAAGPCEDREQAAAVFARYGQLPRRTPGATHPELINARRLTATG